MGRPFYFDEDVTSEQNKNNNNNSNNNTRQQRSGLNQNAALVGQNSSSFSEDSATAVDNEGCRVRQRYPSGEATSNVLGHSRQNNVDALQLSQRDNSYEFSTLQLPPTLTRAFQISERRMQIQRQIQYNQFSAQGAAGTERPRIDRSEQVIQSRIPIFPQNGHGIYLTGTGQSPFIVGGV
eukprot:TRINITY_DN10261_c1_g1_i2.p5 TRINITY_DN10261_c1_g1~~TRINITY_DN10261_c1_g1_i2.p5  ORF type:complete len:180 (+),score=8.15 TRINITY_DN10261_c1_g1_i2:191-730(+)